MLVFLLWLSTTTAVSAQDKIDSLLRIAIGIEANAWQVSSNPIFLRYAPVPTYAKVGINTDLTSGSFRRPQDVGQHKDIGFGAKGFSRAGKWLFFGSFSYGKRYNDSIKYANVARPYDGNPFITGDAVGGNWRGDGLDAQLEVVLPDTKRWETAIKLDYATEQNSRNNDPKPLNRLLNYAIQPSIAYKWNKKNTFSVLGGYSFSDETIETGYYADQNPIIYSIRGYGEFSAGPVITAQRFTRGYGFNFGADYLYKGKGELLLSARFAYRAQDVNEGVAKPVFIGGFDETRGEALVTYLMARKNNGWMVSAKGWFRDGTGYDPIFKSINPAFYFSGLDGKVAYWSRQFHFSYYPGISYTNYFEGIAKTDWTSVMLHHDLGIAMLSHPLKSITFNGEVKMGYHPNIHQQLVINRPSLLSPILVTPYYQYASSSYLKGTLHLSVTYNRPIVAYQFSGSYALQHAADLGTRNTTNISLNLIF